MFEEFNVENGAIKMNGAAYSAPELQRMQGQTVRVSQSEMYPRAVVVFERQSYSFICLATTPAVDMPSGVMGALAERIDRRRRHFGPVKLSAYALDEWIAKIGEQLDQAGKHAAYGNKIHAMNGLLKVAGSCVECLQHHIDAEAEKLIPAFKDVIDEALNETADSEATESAA